MDKKENAVQAVESVNGNYDYKNSCNSITLLDTLLDTEFTHKEIYDAVMKSYGTKDFIEFFNKHYDSVYCRLDKEQAPIMLMTLYQISKKTVPEIVNIIENTEDQEFKILLLLTFKDLVSDNNSIQWYVQTNDSLSNGVFTGKNIPIQKKYKTKKGRFIQEKVIPYELCRNQQEIIEQIPANLRPIHNAVVSLVNAHNRIFTVAELYKVYSGSRLVTLEQANDLIQGLYELSHIWINADVTERLKQAGKDTENHILSGQIVSFSVLSSGKITSNTQIMINSMPLLDFAFICENSPQILRTPFKYVSCMPIRTNEGYSMRDAILRRINTIEKGIYKNANIIDLDNFFLDLGIVINSRQKAKRIRDQLTKILDALKKQEKIKNYEYVKVKCAIKKVSITLQ